jgi:hypothetical protein
VPDGAVDIAIAEGAGDDARGPWLFEASVLLCHARADVPAVWRQWSPTSRRELLETVDRLLENQTSGFFHPNPLEASCLELAAQALGGRDAT